MTRFQIIFTAAVVMIAVGGAMLFAFSKADESNTLPQVTMWGTIDDIVMNEFVNDVENVSPGTLNITYVRKSPETFEGELIAALARGSGPDMIFLPDDLILRQKDKFYVVPFESYSERLFKDSFIQHSELYLSPATETMAAGILAFPFSIDPLVMYWNRDLFTNAGVAVPPTSWTEFFTLVPRLTRRDDNGNITQSLIAFGEVRNVAHAKDIVAMLALQAGTPIIGTDQYGNNLSVFSTRTDGYSPAEQAVGYFTEFSNPVKSSYSWNRAMPNDKSAFIAGKLAVYFGYSSELRSIRAGNPNLNFDVAKVPQVEGKQLTFGKMNAIAILRASPNSAAAYAMTLTLTNPVIQAVWVESSGLPPVRRDMLISLPGDAYKSIFYQSSLISKSWLDPNREATNGVFMRMIENVTSGKQRISEAVETASREFDNLLISNI